MFSIPLKLSVVVPDVAVPAVIETVTPFDKSEKSSVSPPTAVRLTACVGVYAVSAILTTQIGACAVPTLTLLAPAPIAATKASATVLVLLLVELILIEVPFKTNE